MKIQKLCDSYIQKTYKSEINLLVVQTKYYHSLKESTDELLIHERKFKILPKLKFFRGDDVMIIISDTVVERLRINIPYTIEKKIITRDCTKFHNDYIEYEVENKKYDNSISRIIYDELIKYKLN